MGPKYEFTSETKKWRDSTLHRIRRLSDGKIGGWIEKEDNLSQEGNCWVADTAIVAENARVSGNAQVYDYAELNDNVHVYDNAKVYGLAEVYGNAKVFGNAQVYGYAEVYGNANVFGRAKIYEGCIFTGKYEGTSNVNIKNEVSKVIKDFVYKIDDSSKLDVQSTYDSIDAFFDDDSDDSYIDHECLTIITVDTKIPILKLEKTQVKDQNIFKFIVDITNEDGDNYSVKAIIDSKEKFNQLLQSTLESLHSYPQFNKYSDDLENCL